MSDVERHVGFCPHCGNHAPQRVVFNHVYRDKWYGEDGREVAIDDAPNSEAIVCVCETCNGVLVYDGLSYEETRAWPLLVYPQHAGFSGVVPGAIQDVYAEAAAIQRKAPNAFAIMIRKGLEAVCDDRGAPHGPLVNRLKALAERGELPPALAEMTDVLRIVGNTAAHGALQKITPPMTWAIDGFFRAIVEYVYVAPSKLASFKVDLERLKRQPEPKK